MKGPKNGVLKASIQETPIESRKRFHSSSCMLLISVGQPYHEQEKLSATIDLVSGKFKSCTIMVCDTLQKYNLMEHLNAEDAYKISLQKGAEWIERNHHIFSKLGIPYNIIRWDDIIKDVNYKSKLNNIENLYNTNLSYKDAFKKTIDEYVVRVTRRCETLNHEQRYENSLNYLKEECAGMLIWADYEFNFEVYPTKRAKVMTATYDLLIKPLYEEILVPVALRFKRYSNLGIKQMRSEIAIHNTI